MTERIDRRTLLAAAGLSLLAPAGLRAAPGRKALALELVPRDIALRPGQPPSPAWRFASDEAPRFAQGDEVEVAVTNRLPVAVFVHWRGLDGAAAEEPMLARGPVPPGGTATFALALRHAGTLACDVRLTPQAPSLPLPLLPFVVTEPSAAFDADAVLLIEDWLLRPDGSAIPPGTEPTGAAPPLYTVNGDATVTLRARRQDRMRLRFVNGAQRSALAVTLTGLDVAVIAIDGQPCEPFPARDGRLVLAPGTRIDAIVDAAQDAEIVLHDGARPTPLGRIVTDGEPRRTVRPPPVASLPSNGLPDKLALQAALRVDVSLGSPWNPGAPLFTVKRGRVAVLALENRGDSTVIFHLHGHHMRLLDRLDDGWKPFWLDTVAVPAGQIVRTAFAATNPGAYLMESTGIAWASQRRLGSYRVEP